MLLQGLTYFTKQNYFIEQEIFTKIIRVLVYVTIHVNT